MAGLSWAWALQIAMSHLLFFFRGRGGYRRVDCDWSSDVCSSDLLQGAPGERRGAESEDCGGDPGAVARRTEPEPSEEERQERAPRGHVRPPPQANELLPAGMQIGRASCRERE